MIRYVVTTPGVCGSCHFYIKPLLSKIIVQQFYISQNTFFECGSSSSRSHSSESYIFDTTPESARVVSHTTTFSPAEDDASSLDLAVMSSASNRLFQILILLMQNCALNNLDL